MANPEKPTMPITITPSRALSAPPARPAPQPEITGKFVALLEQAARQGTPRKSAPDQPPPQNSPSDNANAPSRSTSPTALPTEAKAPLPIGVIGPQTPTVSHLLTQDPRLKARAWKIIFASINRHKPYNALRPGTQVAIDPETQELLFSPAPPATPKACPQTAMPAAPSSPSAAISPSPAPATATTDNPLDPAAPGQDFGKRLAASVKSYIGTPYSALNCYDLVVRGLEDQGVSYQGANGLRQRLADLAKAHGLPENAYRNGEGLIAAAGEPIYGASFPRIKDAARQTEELTRQLAPRLREGMLLSFSTPSQGHTGVVSKKNGQWTYVNSGVIDHQVDGGGPGKRVGEETLAAEIGNWCRLAQHRGVSLMVSVGRLDPARLAAKGGDLLAGQRPQAERKRI